MSSSWFDSEIWDDPELKTADQIIVYAYLFSKASMIGIAPWILSRVKSATRLSKGKVEKALAELVKIGKVEIHEKGYQVWVKAKLNRSLYGGKCNVNQLKAVCKQLKRAQFTAGYGTLWVNNLVQLYATKYEIDIPYTPQATPSESEPESKPEPESIIKQEVEMPAAPFVIECTPDEWKLLAEFCAKAFAVDNGHRILGWLRKNHPDIHGRPNLLAWYLRRMYEQRKTKNAPTISNAYAYWKDMVDNNRIVPSQCQGGDDISFREEYTVSDWLKGRPIKNRQSDGEFTNMGSIGG